MQTIRAFLWAAAAALAAAGFLFSESSTIWMTAAMSLPLAVQLAGPAGQQPIVLAHIGLFWTAVFCSVAAGGVNGALDDLPAERDAILLSLCALIVLAGGYRVGYSHKHTPSAADLVRLDRRKLLFAYISSFLATSVLGFLAYLSPQLTQPILALTAVKLLLLYLLCAQIFSDKTGAIWLVPIAMAELIEGATGYIASYQLPLIVMLAASLKSGAAALKPKQIAAGAVMLVLLFWASLVWTAIKPDYRGWLLTASASETQSTGDRLNWISGRVSGGIDYQRAFTRWLERVGYTNLYAAALPRFESVSTHFWADALEKVVTPRLLFPDKEVADDTKITSQLTGKQFGQTTSVSIGFVAQAHADFGLPWMFVAIGFVGVLLGAVARFFQTRPCAPVARDAFVSAALVFKFTYEQNIDKALASLVLSSLALFAVFTFAYRPFERWASVTRAPSLAMTRRGGALRSRNG